MNRLFYSPAPRPHDEDARQNAVDLSGFDRAIDHPGLAEIVRRAVALFGAGMAAISIVDGDRQWFPVRIGMEARESARAVSFCAHAILAPDRILCVEDAAADARFAGNPLVLSDPRIRFYAGAPLIDAAGHPLGALCVLDDRKRVTPSPDVLEAFAALARQAVATAAELRPEALSLHAGQESRAADS